MKNQKPFTILEAAVLIVVLAIFALFSVPVFFIPTKQKQEAIVNANVSMAVSAARSRVALKANSGASTQKVAEAVANFLNKTNKNPFTKKAEAYTTGMPEKGSVVLIGDEKNRIIKIIGYTEDIQKPFVSKRVYFPEKDQI